MTTTKRLAVTMVLWTITAGAALAQTPQAGAGNPATEATDAVRPPNAFGAARNIQTIPVVAMTPNAGASYLQNNSQHRHIVAGSGLFYGSVDVPTGSLLTGVELEACDGNAAMSVGAQLLRCAAPGGTACTVMADIGTPLIGTPGCGLFPAPSIATPVVDNQNFRYVIVINITGANTTVSAGGVRIAWQRQVSAAPGFSTFTDVPVSHPFHRFIEALAASGITGGCGSGNYCPDAALTRGQMAVFIATALGLHWPN